MASNTDPTETQLAQAATGQTAIKVTVTKDGVTTVHTVAPGQSLAVEAGSQVVVDAAGLELEAGIDSTGSNVTLTDPNSGEVFTLANMAAGLTEESSSLGFYNNQTGTTDEIAIADILAGVSTAAGGAGAEGGGTGNDGSVSFIDVVVDDGPDGTPGTSGGPGSSFGGETEPEIEPLLGLIDGEGDGTGITDAIQDVVFRNTEGPTVGNVIPNDVNVSTVTEVDGLAILVGSPHAGAFGDMQLNADGAFTYFLGGPVALGSLDFATDTFTYTGTGTFGTDTTEIVIIITDGGTADIMRFGDGNANTLNGDGSNELIIGGGGDDVLTGGGGNDRFGFLESTTNTDTGTDTIVDFNAGDIIDISELLDAGNTTAGNIGIVNDGGGNANIVDNTTDGGGNVIAIVQGVDAANLVVDANGNIAHV